jgi:hypothetical protein
MFAVANSNTNSRDPIVQDSPGTAGGSVSNASAGRVKPLGSGPGGANFSSGADLKAGAPAPNNPYGKGE